MKKIRIAQIVGKWNGGGVESVLMNYFQHFDRSKFQFDFICDSDSKNIPYDEIKRLGGKVIIVSPYQKVFQYNKELFNIFKKNKYLIVHSHINTLSIFPLRIAKKAGIPIRIAHSHSTSNKKEFSRNIIKYILKPFAKIYATDYFACSKYSGEWLFGKNSDIFILNNAIELEKFKFNESKRRELREKFNISNDALIVGHVGRFVTQKNHLFLIKIFYEILKKTKNTYLFLIGNGPLKNEIVSLINKLKINNHVFILDYRNDVNDFYSMFDIFLLPSLYEGLPLVGVEAQCSGLFCVLSDKVTKEINITNNINYVSLDSNPKKWADLIFEKYAKYDRTNSYKKLINSNFDINKEVLKLENKYTALMEECNEKENNCSYH